MRYLLFFLLLPCAGFAQTVHLEDEQIVYKGKVKVDDVEKNELYQRARASIGQRVKNDVGNFINDSTDKNKLSAQGVLRLQTPHSMIRKLFYRLTIEVEKEGYHYFIDSVFISEKIRGGKTTVIPSKKLVERMDISGPTSAQTEKLLNEIDMDFQKLIALLRSDIRRKM
ncbi:MAG TPA: hypothetical protein VNR87_14360 [Flavisolibacter sp.]|nr:hypothetical protein [Flavisolibacter sp.]